MNTLHDYQGINYNDPKNFPLAHFTYTFSLSWGVGLKFYHDYITVISSKLQAT